MTWFPANYVRNRVTLDCKDATRTVQDFKESCDVNYIMEKYQRDGIISQMSRDPQVGDFSNFEDYHSALNQIMDAEIQFQEIPSKIRERFNNDPEKFFNFAVDPANLDELRKMGLAYGLEPELEAPVVEEPAPVVEETTGS